MLFHIAGGYRVPLKVELTHTYTHTHMPTYTHTHIHTYTKTHIHTYNRCGNYVL